MLQHLLSPFADGLLASCLFTFRTARCSPCRMPTAPCQVPYGISGSLAWATLSCSGPQKLRLPGLSHEQNGTVTFFIQTFFIRDKVYTNFLYTGQSLYGTKFIRDKVYTGTKFIRGQS